MLRLVAQPLELLELPDGRFVGAGHGGGA
jgi:hypothetical protein